MPGTYTVRMTKDGKVYETPLNVTIDPRSTFKTADRQAQFDLSMKLQGVFGTMTDTVAKMNGLRRALDDRAKKATDPTLKARLTDASAQVDSLRRKIVATKEGGAITGEERLREYLANVYGNVVGYEGRPSQTQVERADSLAKELGDVVKSFDDWSAKELPAINAALAAGKLDPITVAVAVPENQGSGADMDTSAVRYFGF